MFALKESECFIKKSKAHDCRMISRKMGNLLRSDIPQNDIYTHNNRNFGNFAGNYKGIHKFQL